MKKNLLPVFVFTSAILLLTSYLSFSQTWTQKENFGGTARAGAVSFSIGTKGYFGTGQDGSTKYGDLWEWDQPSNSWTQKATLPGGFVTQGGVGFSIGTKGYIGTGDAGAPPQQECQNFYQWDQSTNTWVQKANVPVGVNGAVGFSIGTKGYIGTGHNQSFVQITNLQEYDPATDTWTQKAPFGGAARNMAVGFSIGTKGYIGTGFDATHYQDFWEWDQSTNTWTQMANFGGTARRMAVGFSIGTKGYVGTGYDITGNKRDFWEWDQVSNTWTSKAAFGGTARNYATGFSIGTKGYIGTGSDACGYKKDFWEFTPPAILSPTICMTVSSNSPVSTGPNSVASADFNLDGNADIATASNSGNLSILLGNGAGGFSAYTSYSMGTNCVSLAIADFNGDGIPDVATVNNSTQAVYIRLGNGDGTFQASSNQGVANLPYDITIADFNGDCNADFATANDNTQGVSRRLGNGAGGFGAQLDYAAGGGGTHSITSGDFNGDGKVDLAMGNISTNNIFIKIGDGTGAFTGSNTYSAGGSPLRMINADFNGDGKLDLATTRQSPYVGILLGNGDGTFGASSIFAANSNPDALCSGDFNRDGKLDIATSNYDGTTSSVSLFLGNGDGTFQTASNFSAANYPNGITNADFNGDGKPDWAVANQNSNSVSAFLNCTVLCNLTVTINTALTTNVSCYGGSNGSATVSVVSGGTSPYTYTWNTTPAQSGPTATGLTATNYSVLVTDANSCTATATVTITQPPVLGVSVPSHTNVSCYGGNNGSATATATGGTSPINYFWNPTNQTTPTATGLIADNYYVSVSDTYGCTATASVTITQPSALSITTNTNSVSCNGGSNGSATANPSGGTSPYTYLWSTSPAQAGATASNLTAGTYSVLITDANGCTAPATVIITQPGFLSVSNSGNVTICSSQGASISGTAGGGVSPYNYNWSPSAGIGCTTCNSTGASPTITTTYTLTATDANGCTAMALVMITVNPTPSVSFSSTTPGCTGAPVDFTNTGTSSGVSWSWAFGSGSVPATATVQNPSGVLYTTSGTKSVTLTTTNSTTGCTSAATQTIVINQTPSTPISGSNSPICSGQTLSLTASSTGTTYSWSGPNSFTSSSQNPTIGSVTTASAGCYSVTATTNGCASPAAITCVTINQTPAAPVVGSNSPVCVGNDISLTASGSGVSYSWTGPGGFTSTSQNPVITPATTSNSGTYSVTASNNGCTSSVGTTSVTVNPTPSAPTASSNSPVNAGNTLSLSASTIASATYSWSGNTFSSSLQNPTIASVTTSNAGCYTVTATVNGCTSSAAITCVTVITISITTSTQSVSCNGGNDGGAAVTNVTGGASPYTYLWNPTGETDQAIFNLSAGIYTVTVTDAIGSSAIATVNVTQPSPITVITGGQVNVSCFGGSNGKVSAIAGGGTSPYSYSWNSFPVQTTATASNLSAGNYTVTVSDANGCTGTKTVAITQPVALTVSMTITNTNCGSTNGIATANVSGGTAAYSYLWSNAATTSQISNLASQTYSVTVTDSKGCMVNSSATIGIIPSNFSLAFSGTPQNGPAPLNVTFSNTTPSMSSYNFTWYWGDGNNVSNNNATVFYTYNFSGTYNVALIAASIANGCTDTLVKAPYINVTGAGCTHNATVTPSAPVNACVGDTVILTAGTNAVAPFTYQWNIGAVAISGENNSTIAVTQSGYYSVTIIKNNCPVTSSAVQVNFTTHPQQPVITSAGNIVPCVGGSSTLTSSSISGVTYSWNTTPVQTTQSIIVNSSGNYVVTVTNSAGCSTSAAPFTVNASLVQVPICLVTVDSISQNNIIVWEKQLNQPIDSFIVFREIATNNYQPIGAVLYDSLSLFIDTVRTKYFPNTGDPNSGTYRYKIAVRDTCGNYSPLSPYHNTIYIINNSGTFFWSQLYTIENASNPVTTYDLLRDDNSTGVWNVINSVAGTQQTVTDPNYATYQSTASWRVKTQWGISCTASIKNPVSMATNLNSSRSNVYKVNNPISVNEAVNNFYVNIYPNPNSGIFTLDLRNNISGSAIIKVYNVLGEEVKQINCLGCKSKTTIDLSKQSKGVYYLQISTNDKVITKKIIIE
ncbi:MAG: VCBS repeat-containing protein [Bacteroidetes bacterium]|nr:VCBS repeat-containing protein [Bacteroidota bacterium]